MSCQDSMSMQAAQDKAHLVSVCSLLNHAPYAHDNRLDRPIKMDCTETATLQITLQCSYSQGHNNKSPVCPTTIFHRLFAQRLLLKGYNFCLLVPDAGEHTACENHRFRILF